VRRNGLAAEMQAMLDGAAFNDEPLDEVQAKQLINQAEALLGDVSSCAANLAGCAM